MTDTSTTAADPVVEDTSASEPQDNANAADLHVEGTADPEPEPEPEAAAEGETAEAEPGSEEPEPEAKPKKTKEQYRQESFEKRLNKEVGKKHDLQRQLDAANQRLAALEAPEGAEHESQPASRLTEADVERRAAELVANNAYQASIATTVSAGEKEYGKTEFTEACNLLAEMGANEKPEFLQVVTDTDNGHKVLQHLGENPDKAERILALPPLKMAAAIARISVDLGKPAKAAPVSAAPAPIKTLDGRARPNPTPDKMNDDEFDEFFNSKMKNLRSR